MQPTLVSVVIPTFNRAELLRECLGSIRAQTYRPLEVIVADDGSTDNTAKVAEAFIEQAKEDAGIELIYLPLPRGGAPKARNAGVARAKGGFIQYVDSDDLLHPRKIEFHIAAFEANPDVEFVWGLYSYFEGAPPANGDYKIESVVRQARCFVARRWKEIPGMVHIGMFRREACRKIGPWCESLARWQDVEYMMRFARLQPRVLRMEAVLYHLRHHAGGQIHDLYKQSAGVHAGLHSLKIIEGGFPEIPSPDADMRRAMSNFYKSVAETALKSGMRDEFRAAMRGAARHRPDFSFRMRAVCIQLICRWLGPARALKFLQDYHAARLPAQPTCVD